MASSSATEPTRPRFSVLVPALNAAPFIHATLSSIRRQDFPSLEVIVMDGGSSDATAAIAEAFAGLHVRVFSEPDHGQLHAVQKAADRATGEVLYWINADDILMPGSLHEVDRVFRTRPDIDVVYSDDFGFDESKRTFVNGGIIRGHHYSDHALHYRHMYSECVFWRREATPTIDPALYDLRIATCFAWFLQLREGRKLMWIPKRLGAFRILPGQMSERHLSALDDEMRRVRAGAWARQGWSERSIRWRRAATAPGHWLRHRLQPAVYAGGRALTRCLDGSRRRRAMTEAFYQRWLQSSDPADPALIGLLYR